MPCAHVWSSWVVYSADSKKIVYVRFCAICGMRDYKTENK